MLRTMQPGGPVAAVDGSPAPEMQPGRQGMPAVESPGQLSSGSASSAMKPLVDDVGQVAAPPARDVSVAAGDLLSLSDAPTQAEADTAEAAPAAQLSAGAAEHDADQDKQVRQALECALPCIADCLHPWRFETYLMTRLDSTWCAGRRAMWHTSRTSRCSVLRQGPVLCNTPEPVQAPAAADDGSLAFDGQPARQDSGVAAAEPLQQVTAEHVQSALTPLVDDVGESAAAPVVADASVAAFSEQGLSSMSPQEADKADAIPAAQPVALPQLNGQTEDEQAQVTMCSFLRPQRRVHSAPMHLPVQISISDVRHTWLSCCRES